MRTARTERSTPQIDWDPADIMAALWKRRLSFRRLSREHGYANGSLRKALRHPWPKAEQLIARAIGTTPRAIWPSRYNPDGTPKRGRAPGARALRKAA